MSDEKRIPVHSVICGTAGWFEASMACERWWASVVVALALVHRPSWWDSG